MGSYQGEKMEILYFLVALFATTVGSIGGMSGGLIIKPTMDALSGLDVATVSFMSSCTVLAMSSVNVVRSRKNQDDIQLSTTIPLAVGACLGGVLGKAIFRYTTGDRALIQSVLLGIIYVVIFIYVKEKKKIKSLKIKEKGVCFTIGTSLGVLSSFLGVGGGPLNMAVLFYFIGSSPKVAAKQSFFMIFFSQIGSFATTAVTGFPENLNYIGIICMMIGGCFGAVLGAKISKTLTDERVETCLTDTLVAVMLLNLYNICRLIL